MSLFSLWPQEMARTRERTLPSADMGGASWGEGFGPKATEWESELGRAFPTRREQLLEDVQTLWGMEGKPKAGRPASTEMSCSRIPHKGQRYIF